MPPAGRSFVTPCVVLGLYLNPTESDVLTFTTLAHAHMAAQAASIVDACVMAVHGNGPGTQFVVRRFDAQDPRLDTAEVFFDDGVEFDHALPF